MFTRSKGGGEQTGTMSDHVLGGNCIAGGRIFAPAVGAIDVCGELNSAMMRSLLIGPPLPVGVLVSVEVRNAL